MWECYWHRRSVGLVLAAVQLQNGKTGALGPYGATLLGRADAWLCSVLCLLAICMLVTTPPESAPYSLVFTVVDARYTDSMTLTGAQ